MMRRAMIIVGFLWWQGANCATAQTSLRWAFELSRPVAPTWEVYRGESVLLQPAFLDKGMPAILPEGADATLYWQAEDMDAWWSVPATAKENAVSAVFGPGQDSGAERYRFFIGVTASNSISYRANGHIKMLDAPGASPNELPLPAKQIDFNTVEVKNAPWLSEEEDPIAAQWQSTHMGTRNPHRLTAEDVGALAVNDSGAVEGIIIDGPIVMRQDVYHSFFDLRDMDTGDADVWAFPHQQNGKSELHMFASMADVTSAVESAGSALRAATLPIAGGTMEGPLVLAPSGVAWQGVGVATNFFVRAEWDGTNVNFNVYGVGR